LVLKQEQEEYNREGIEWQNIDFFNNQIICDLVEAPHKGILSIMDDASKMTAEKVTDELLLETMDRQLKQHNHYTSRQLKPADKNMRHKIDFRITHYAGDVTYCVNGFLDKNKDTLFQDFKRLMYNSRDANLKEMFPEGSQHISEVRKNTLRSVDREKKVDSLAVKLNQNDGCLNKISLVKSALKNLMTDPP
jgi:myosin-1